MTKKKEMAEWVLDFFRRGEVSVGQMVMFRNIQNDLHELAPKEREMFVPVVNELIENGYFSFESGALQYLRLTEKGCTYILNPNAELDCCRDAWIPNRMQAQYLDGWHSHFVSDINILMSTINMMKTSPDVSDEDKRGLKELESRLQRPDVKMIEEDLANRSVKRSTIESIARLNKDLADVCLKHIRENPLMIEFFRVMAGLQFDRDKEGEIMRLNSLRIPVREG